MKMKNRVLAVLALALLMINMAPVKRAEAASEICVNAQQINYDTLPTYQQIVDAVTAHFDVSAEGVTAQNTMLFTYRGDYYYIFYGENIDKLECYGLSNGANINAKSFCTYVGFNPIDGSTKLSTFSGGLSGVYFENRDPYCGYIWGKPIYCWARNGVTPYINAVTDYPYVPVKYDYRYSSSGPLAATWAADISNLMYFGPAEADDVEDFYVASNWEARYDKWVHRIIYRLTGELPALAGSAPTDGNMYRLYTESVIAFPSKDVVTGWISSGMSPVELYFEKGQSNWRQTVYDGKDTFVKVKVTNESIPYYHSLMNGTHVFQVDIPMTEIIASVDESFDGGMRGYYGLSQEMWDMWKCAIYEYKVPYEIYTVLYAKEDIDTMVYGNMYYSVPNWTQIDPLLNGYAFTGGVIEKPLEDITNSDKQEIQMDTTKEELAKRTEELEQLKKEYAEVLKLNAGSDDLFGLFSDLADGMRSSSGSFKAISTAVGNVFAFFPGEITSVLYAGFIAMLVIAIYKALRG